MADADGAVRASGAGGGAHARAFVAMGTRMRLVAHGDRAPAALADAERLVHRLDALLSRFRPGSEVTALARAGGRWVAVSADTDGALRAALRAAALTGGLCDPVLGALVEAWAPVRSRGAAPDDELVAHALARCGPHLLERRRARRPRPDAAAWYRLAPGALVDLGAVGKGYAAGRVAALLRRRGVTSALVACGASSVAAVGARPDGSPWRVGLRAPLDVAAPGVGRPRCVAAVPLVDEHLSVSGDDAPDGRLRAPRRAHVLDPRTGRPAATDLRAAAVVAGDGVAAEALATAMLVLGAAGAQALARRPPVPVDAVLTAADGRVLTAGAARLGARVPA